MCSTYHGVTDYQIWFPFMKGLVGWLQHTFRWQVIHSKSLDRHLHFFFINCTYLWCFPIGFSTLLWQMYDKNLDSVLQRTWESILVLQVAREIHTSTTVTREISIMYYNSRALQQGGRKFERILSRGRQRAILAYKISWFLFDFPVISLKNVICCKSGWS